MRSKMVKVLDNYYFKELKGDELTRLIASAVEVRPDITTMEQAEKMMGEQ